ncbi:MAG TPA: outer membrane protein transport protein [Vicinamibacteria bacterium]|nr:outer membrane protein transport protein [Vicinamibacteria bacterium]
MPLRRSPALEAALFLAVLLLPPSVAASGFSIYEQGGRGMGFAGAFTALSDDPSAIFHNAAGVAFLKGRQVYLGSTLVGPKSRFEGDDPFPGAGTRERQDVGILPVPTLYYAQRLRERLVLGIGVHSPFGLKTQWADPDSFSGRFISLEADLKSFSVNPTVAYKLADRLSVGGGLDLRLSKVKLRRRVPSINPFTQKVIDVAEAELESDYGHGLGFNLGVLAKPSEKVSLGIAYRHKVTVDYQGGARFTLIPTGNSQLDALAAASIPSGRPGLTTSITFPAILSGGAAYQLERWTVAADVVWFQWSTFDRLELDFEQGTGLAPLVIEEDYANIWQFRVGLERRLGARWAVRGGYHFDDTPVPTASMSPLLPDQDRHGFSVGGSWTGGRLRLDAGAWYLHLAPRSTEGLSRDRYDGTYDNSALTFGLSVGYSF